MLRMREPTVNAFADCIAAASKYRETKQWIDLTRTLISHGDGSVLEHADNRLHYSIQREIMTNLENALPTEWSQGMQSELGKIFALTIQLFRLLHTQRASFRVDMMQAGPLSGNGQPFLPEAMEDVGIDRQECVVGMGIFPGVSKWGDEHGENVRPSGTSTGHPVLTCAVQAENMTVLSRARGVAQKRLQ